MELVRRTKKPLSVFSLVAINIIAVDSLRTLPLSAEYGFSLVFYYLLAAVIFFIPVAMVAAELATGWPKTGGLYVWVSEAFGKRLGFITIWLQWIYNVVWYPTVLIFVASTFAYIFSPELAQNKLYLFLTILITFWFATLINCFGMAVSSFISAIGAIIGTILPMAFIIILAVIWVVQGRPTDLDVSWHGFFPDTSQLSNVVLFSGILFGLVGMEMSAVHAGDVANPRHDYPRALLYSTMIIFASLVLGSLAIAVVVPQPILSIVTGLMDAFAVFFKIYHMQWMTPVLAGLIILGSVCGVSAWIIGPTKGLMVSAEDGVLPRWLAYHNKFGVPVVILVVQAVIFTLLSFLLVFLESINDSYWLLSELAAQLALLVYVFMFAAGIKLRRDKPEVERAYRVPGPNFCFYLLSGLGLITCILVIILGFIPPTQLKMSNTWYYTPFLLLGMSCFFFIPLLILKGKKIKHI